MITIIVVNLNNGSGLAKTLTSFRSQQCDTCKVLVIDGGSHDNSVNLILDNQDIISYWQSKSDGGVYDAMNIGLQLVATEYLLFLNSGDTFYAKNSLSAILQYLIDYPNNDIFYCDIEYLKRGIKTYSSYPPFIDVIYFLGNSLCHQGVVYRNSVFHTVGPYSTEYKISADWAHMVDALIKYNKKFQKIPGVHICYDTNGVSSKSDGVKLLWQERIHHIKTNYPWLLIDYSDIELFSSKRFFLLRKINKNKWLRRFLTIIMEFFAKLTGK